MPSSPKNTWSLELASFALVAGVSFIGWLISGSYKAVIGVWTGGLVSIINFNWLRMIVKGALTQGRAARYAASYLLKFLFVMVFATLLLYSGLADPLAFLAGFTIIVLTVSFKGHKFLDRS